MSRRALLILNRHARQGQKWEPIVVNHLSALGLDVVEAAVDSPKDVSEAIRRHRNQVDLVIVGGGDGTMNAAIEGLIETQLPLGVLPLGTANDLARSLNLPLTIPEACAVIANGKVERIDLGWVNGKHYFNTGSLGLTVKISRKLTREAKHRWGVLAYGSAAVRILWSSRPFLAELTIDGKEVKHMRSVLIVVGNGRYWGGRLTIAKDATINDQCLDVCSLNIRHWWQIFTVLPALWTGDYSHALVDGFRCKEVKIHTDHPHDINTDGESTVSTPAQFRVIPQAISVLVPNN